MSTLSFTLARRAVSAVIVATLAACGGGGGGETAVTPPASDTTPAPFSFVDQTGVATDTVITSAPVTITGINAPAPVTVAGGTYSVGCTATYVSSAGTISNGQGVCVRHVSAATESATTSTTLTVGGVSDVFSSTTAGPEADTTPEAFSFVDQTGVATSTVITSAPVTITGIDAPAAVTVAGGTYSVGCTATYVSSAGTISNGETVCARHVSAATASTATDTTLTVGGVSDVFRSTTAGPVVGDAVGLLPFLTGAGDVRLYDPTLPESGTNPVTVDTGLAPPPAGAVCYDCFGQAEVFFAGTVSGSTVSNVHGARLAYAKRGSGNDAGGIVYKVNLIQGASHAPVRISTLTDACRIVRAETTNLADVDATAVVVERAGADTSCGATADNVAAVIRLDSAPTDAALALPLALDAGNPLHARTDATGAVTGYVSFETSTADPAAPILLVRRDASLGSPATLLALADTTGANLERADLTHLFVTAHRVDNSLELYRVESDGNLSPRLYSFAGFNAGNPIQDGWRDATNLYFSDANLLLRIPVDSATENAAIITTLDPALRIENRVLDASTVPGRIVFEAQDDSITVAGGVFSVAANADNAAAIVLANNADGDGGFAVLALATGGRAYINVAHHGGVPTHADALRVGTDGSAPLTTASAYWAGYTRATSFDAATEFAAPVASLFLATRADNGDGTGTDTLARVDPATGATGAAMGSVDGTSVFLAMNVHGLGNDTLVRVERDRFGVLDYDVFALSADTADSLAPLAVTDGSNDIPLDSLQRNTGNLCLLCL